MYFSINSLRHTGGVDPATYKNRANNAQCENEFTLKKQKQNLWAPEFLC